MYQPLMNQVEADAEVRKQLQRDLDMSDSRRRRSRKLENAVSSRRAWVVPASGGRALADMLDAMA
jgi:hypothetical protein